MTAYLPTFRRCCTLTATTGAIGVVGDGLAQHYERPQGGPPLTLATWDGERSSRLVLYRVCQAPILETVWKSFDVAAVRLQLSPLRAVLFKVAADQALLLPSFTVIFFLSQSLLEGESVARAVERTEEGFFPMLCSGFQFYSVAHLVTFGVVPVGLRVAWANAVGTFWTAFMSYSNQSLRKRMTSRREKEGEGAVAAAAAAATVGMGQQQQEEEEEEGR